MKDLVTYRIPLGFIGNILLGAIIRKQLRDIFSYRAVRIAEWVSGYYALLDESMHGSITERDFVHAFELMGVQRHLKAAGIFARLNHRDGKPGYMLDIPRTLSYVVDLLPRHEELGFLVQLIEDRCLPQLESRA